MLPRVSRDFMLMHSFSWNTCLLLIAKPAKNIKVFDVFIHPYPVYYCTGSRSCFFYPSMCCMEFFQYAFLQRCWYYDFATLEQNSILNSYLISEVGQLDRLAGHPDICASSVINGSCNVSTLIFSILIGEKLKHSIVV